MNAMVTRNDTALAVMDEGRLIDVMRASLYPGAKPESVALVLGYCKAKRLDPMLKPVHIVPMWVKDPSGRGGEMRDVIMPGIASYRIDAARTGQYAGKSEPMFGPVVSIPLGGETYQVPEWCKMTVRRIVGGHVCDFTATEYWIENYATVKRDMDQPNAMWAKRARGQLAKCAEAQALRMAFPEATGGEPTAEEMEGKGTEPRHVQAEQVHSSRPSLPGGLVEHVRGMEQPAKLPIIWGNDGLIYVPKAKWVGNIQKAVTAIPSIGLLRSWRADMGAHLASVMEAGDADLVTQAEAIITARMDSFADPTPDQGDAFEESAA